MSSYFTIQSATEGFYKERGSKFIAKAFPVRTELEIKGIQDQLRNEYHDARHHCYAWVLGMDNQVWRANDDGEPSHSAGDPILGQIRSHELTSVLVVVIRYFGGTKLGVGGLIQAYKVAADDALRKARRIEIFESRKLIMKFTYDMMSHAERIITEFDLDVQERHFEVTCEIHSFIKKDLIESFNLKTKDLYNMQFEIQDADL